MYWKKINKNYKLTRLVAYIIDWLISALSYSFFSLLYYSIVTQEKTSRIDFYKLSIVEGTFIIIICFAIYIFYYIIVPYLHDGQTIGKRICHLRVIKLNENANTLFVHSLRFMIFLFIEGFLFYPSSVSIQFIERFVEEGLADILYKVSILTTLISVALAMVTHRFIHDYLSCSQVVKDK